MTHRRALFGAVLLAVVAPVVGIVRAHRTDAGPIVRTVALSCPSAIAVDARTQRAFVTTCAIDEGGAA